MGKDESDLEKIYLPNATSNFTNRTKHINLNVDDFVWVYFENGEYHFPVILDLCNSKDNYPGGASGTQPDYYNNITADSDIGESTVTYSGQYNKVNSFDFGEDIHVDIDEENKQIVIYNDGKYIVLSADGNLHLKFDKIFLKTDNEFKSHSAGNKIEITSTGLKITDANNNVFDMSSSGVTINNNFKVLQ